MTFYSVLIISISLMGAWAHFVGLSAQTIVLPAFIIGVFSFLFIPIFLNASPFGSNDSLRDLPAHQRRSIVFQKNWLQAMCVAAWAVALISFLISETQSIGS